jgi:hypothetical protein
MCVENKYSSIYETLKKLGFFYKFIPFYSFLSFFLLIYLDGTKV